MHLKIDRFPTGIPFTEIRDRLLQKRKLHAVIEYLKFEVKKVQSTSLYLLMFFLFSRVEKVELSDLAIVL